MLAREEEVDVEVELPQLALYVPLGVVQAQSTFRNECAYLSVELYLA